MKEVLWSILRDLLIKVSEWDFSKKAQDTALALLKMGGLCSEETETFLKSPKVTALFKKVPRYCTALLKMGGGSLEQSEEFLKSSQSGIPWDFLWRYLSVQNTTPPPIFQSTSAVSWYFLKSAVPLKFFFSKVKQEFNLSFETCCIWICNLD